MRRWRGLVALFVAAIGCLLPVDAAVAATPSAACSHSAVTVTYACDGIERSAAGDVGGSICAGVTGATRSVIGAFAIASGFAAEDGVSLSLSYKPGWSAAQRAAADSKVAALNDAATSGGLRVTPVERSGTSAASRYSKAGGNIPSGSDVDHTIDLQLGGHDEIGNMSPLDISVNRSLGSQIGWQLRGVAPGTCVVSARIC